MDTTDDRIRVRSERARATVVSAARTYESDLPRFLDKLEQGVGLSASPALVDKLHRHCGSLGGEAAGLLISRLCRLPPDHDEWCALATVLLNHETCCMRDFDQFELASSVLPDLIERAERDEHRTLRAWSAGCSTGEEAWSLAVLLAQALIRARKAVKIGAGVALTPPWRIEVVGSDLSQSALAIARAASYSTRPPSAFRRMAREQLDFFPEEGSEVEQRRCIDPSLRPFVHFEKRNIARMPPPPGRFDVVVCRNVVPYLTTSAREDVAAALMSKLKPGGCLLIGPTDLPKDCEGLQIMWSAAAMIYRAGTDPTGTGSE